jgi:hypothetical protein
MVLDVEEVHDNWVLFGLKIKIKSPTAKISVLQCQKSSHALPNRLIQYRDSEVNLLFTHRQWWRDPKYPSKALYAYNIHAQA